MHAPDRQPKKRSAHIDDAANEAPKRSAARRSATDDRAAASAASHDSDVVNPRATRSSASAASRTAKPPAFYVAVGVAVVAIVVACVLGFMAFSNTSQGRDPNAALGQLEGKTPEEIQKELDRIVEEGMFNISIASSVEFADGTSEGELRIENVPNNPYLMKVEITRDDTGEAVYTSGMIEPNHHIQKARLDVDLDAGDYPCTAVFYAYGKDDEQLVGQAAAKMTVSVLG